MLTSLRKSSSVSSFCMHSLLQVYGIVHRVSFIFHLNVFLVSVCARGFGYLLCWSRGRGIGMTGMYGEIFVSWILQLFPIKLKKDFFWKTFFYPRQLPTPTPTPTTQNLYPRPTTDDPRHLATLGQFCVLLFRPPSHSVHFQNWPPKVKPLRKLYPPLNLIPRAFPFKNGWLPPSETLATPWDVINDRSLSDLLISIFLTYLHQLSTIFTKVVRSP